MPLNFLSRLAFLLFSLLLSATVYAQVDVIEETDSKRRERQLEIETAIRRAAKAAEARQALETTEDITYEQILADPDNLDLNFRYAKTQVARGEVVGASATLERILMINPDLVSIRLFYALVLFRLDNLEEAEREFQLVRKVDLPEAQRRQVDQHLDAIRRRRQRTKLSTSTSIGWGFDTNRNAAPSSKRRMASDSPTALTGTSKKRRDTNVLAINSVNVTHDLGTQAGHQLIGSLAYFLGEQTAVDDLDIQSFSAEAGAVLKTPLADFTPTGFADYLYLSRETFLRSQGLKLRADQTIGERFALSTKWSWTQEDFVGTVENTTSPERTGDRINATVGGQYALSPTMQLAADIGYENKDVDGTTQFNAYEGMTLTGSHTWLLGKGQFLLSSLAFTVKSYDEPDTSISARTRRDEQLRARLSYGAPVSLLMGEWLPAPLLKNLTATFSVEQFRSLSNITNYTYSNTKLGMMFTKRIDF